MPADTSDFYISDLHRRADKKLIQDAHSRPSARLLRTLQLLQILQSGRICTVEELSELCSVSRRTVFRDLAVLEVAGFAVKYDERRRGYFIRARRLKQN